MSKRHTHSTLVWLFLQFQTQTETLERSHKKQSLAIGVPKEVNFGENRVALVPNSVRAILGSGHKVIVESGAGEKSNFSDSDYVEAGAIISPSKEEVFKSKDPDIKFSSKDVDEAVYLWQLKGTFCNGEKLEKRGYVTVLK